MATPNDTTDNHSYQLWGDGQTEWEHRTDFEALDVDVFIRDTDSNRGNYTPKDGSAYLSTDTLELYFGNGNQWNKQTTLGSGSGSNTTLDLGDDGNNESAALGEIATQNDTNSVATEPAADKLLLDMGVNWPTADTAAGLETAALDAIADIDAALRSGADTTLITGTAGTSGNVPMFNADGDIVDSGNAASDIGTGGSGSGAVLDSGSLGTLASTDDPGSDFTLTGVSTDETVEIAPPRIYPSSADQFSGDYAFNAVDWYRSWDDTAGEWDVTITVNWDVDSPPGDLALDYTIYEGSGGSSGSSHPRGGFDAPSSVTSTSYTLSPWEDAWVDTGTAGGNVTATLPPDSGLSDGDRVEVGVEDATHDTDVAANTGQSIVGANPTLTSQANLTFAFRASDSTWMVK